MNDYADDIEEAMGKLQDYDGDSEAMSLLEDAEDKLDKAAEELDEAG